MLVVLELLERNGRSDVHDRCQVQTTLHVKSNARCCRPSTTRCRLPAAYSW
jgi:hypothetical protein